MGTKDLVLDQPRQRQVIEHLVDFLENGVRLIDVFLQTKSTFFRQAKNAVHPHILMGSP